MHDPKTCRQCQNPLLDYVPLRPGSNIEVPNFRPNALMPRFAPVTEKSKLRRDRAFAEAFRRAFFCNSIGPSGFTCQLVTRHAGQHFHEAAGVRRRWGA